MTRTRIEYVASRYFVDLWIGDGWKNAAACRTRAEAERIREQLRQQDDANTAAQEDAR